MSELMTFSKLEISSKEVFRYIKSPNPTKKEEQILSDLLDEIKVFPRVCYDIFDVNFIGENDIKIGPFNVHSRALYTNLCNCKKVIVFAATIGIELDKLLKKYSSIEPTKALILQGLGATEVEALCDAFVLKFENENKQKLHPRFSPGYGDLSLDLQDQILKVLNATKQVGIYLTEGGLMMPTKSVTAFCGIEE